MEAYVVHMSKLTIRRMQRIRSDGSAQAKVLGIAVCDMSHARPSNIAYLVHGGMRRSVDAQQGRFCQKMNKYGGLNVCSGGSNVARRCGGSVINFCRVVFRQSA